MPARGRERRKIAITSLSLNAYFFQNSASQKNPDNLQNVFSWNAFIERSQRDRLELFR